MARRISQLCTGKRVVGIAMVRCEYLIPTMLGVMAAGAAYMPLNPNLPVPAVCDMVITLKKYNIKNAAAADEIEYGLADNARLEDLSDTASAAYYMQTYRQKTPPSNEREKAIIKLLEKELNSGNEKSIKIGIEDNIFDEGLDSLAVLSLISEFEKEGMNFSVQDIYANPTVKLLAQKANLPQMLVRLNDVNSDKIVCFFPYAGGVPQAFSTLAKEMDCSAVGVNYDFFPAEYSAGTIAEYVAEELKQYKKITLASICIGSIFALDTAAVLEKKHHPADEIYISSSIPQHTPKGKNPWRLLPESTIKRVLEKKLNESLPEKFSTETFLRDTDRYFSAVSQSEKLSAKAYVAFAKEDTFTKGFEKQKERWNKYFDSCPTYSVFDTNDHYFMAKSKNVFSRMRGGSGNE